MLARRIERPALLPPHAGPPSRALSATHRPSRPAPRAVRRCSRRSPMRAARASRSWRRRLAEAARGGGFELRGVVEDAFVDGAELFDAEVGVGDALAAAAFRAGRRHQRLEDAGDDGGVDAGAVDERRAIGREELAVERGDRQVVRLASRVREARDRLQAPPTARAASDARPDDGVCRWCSCRDTADATPAPAREPPRTAGTARDTAA